MTGETYEQAERRETARLSLLSAQKRIAELEREKADVVKLCWAILNVRHRRATYELAESILVALGQK